MSCWTYIRSEPGLWTAGHYNPDGSWAPESDHDSEAKAAARVHYLNGGVDEDLLAACSAMFPLLCDAILHGMPVTRAVADARNLGASALAKAKVDS